MIVKDLQFARHFLLNEISLDPSVVSEILECNLEVHQDGEPDTVIDRGHTLVYYHPSSITKFLFTVLYTLLSKNLGSDIYKDKLGLALLGMCKDYVYADYDPQEFSGPPVLVSYNKLPVPQFILSELIEPLMGKINRLPVFFVPCRLTDTTRIIEKQDKLGKHYNLPKGSIAYSDFPLVLVNCNIYNKPAQNADIVTSLIMNEAGEEKGQKVVRALLTENDLLKNLIVLLKTLRGEPTFVVEFLEYLGSNIDLTENDTETTVELQAKIIESDSFLSKHIKTADDWSRQPQSARVNRQWSQWSMMMGLIEKQLIPMRGSMWTTTDAMKPIEDRKRKMIADKTKEKGSQLNFEELLEVARDMYNHKAKPGTLIEDLLKDNRVWKF